MLAPVLYQVHIREKLERHGNPLRVSIVAAL